MKKTIFSVAMSFLVAVPFAGCAGGSVDEPSVDEPSDENTAAAAEAVKNTDFHVFVIPMENHDAGQIFGNTSSAPYINNTLIPKGARGTNFIDTLPALWSEPHYVLMEGGTNAFADHTFTTDNNPSSGNSTSSTSHLVTQMKNAGVSWMSYQEDMTKDTCPISGSGNYAPKHDPFVFFKDVSGSPPSASNAYCKNHHRPYSQLGADLSSGTVANYAFITPSLIHDMHDACGAGNAIKCGDNFLSSAVPPILKYLETHKGVLFIVWDEGENTPKIPFLALGPNVKVNYNSTGTLSHASLVKSVDRIFGLSVLPAAVNSNDFRDLFTSDVLGVGNLGDECPNDANKKQPGVCGCGKTERSDNANFLDAGGYKCTDWIDYDCKQSGYTQAQQNSLLANCSLSCGVCL
jgi:hypothetical protein